MFLYMGVFPRNHKIPRSKLVDMWNVDGFLKRKKIHDALECLEELVWNSLVMIYDYTTCHIGNKDIKTCGLHTSLWYFSTTEARNKKFCLVLNCLDDGLNEDLIGQCRLSFHNNILCNIKDVYKCVEDNCASTTRSLFCYGPYHPYEVPICFGLKLLRELDVLTIRLYEFPIEILQLIELRYLALTLDGKLPPSISQLSNLRFLIVGRHFVIIKPSRDRYLPAEIWNMSELQHLQAMWSDLPHPRGASIENLSTLSDVSPRTCTKGVFKALPNLKKLRIRIELGPYDDGTPLRCFDHISSLEKLTSLKCVVVYPTIVPPLASITTLPSNLRKLSLSGLGFPWKETRNIATLPNLEVLKLRNYAFRGPHWRVEKLEFPNLQLLDCFEHLYRLTLKHCYKYERMAGQLRESIGKIEFFACNPSGILQMQETLTYPWIEWKIHNSFSDGENETQ